MACPYFVPAEMSAERVEGCPVRPPLGALYRGACLVDDVRSEPPDTATLNGHCNFGYARSVCCRFPDEPGPDAVRFSIARDDGRRVDILYTMEQDHRPERDGRIEFDRDEDSCSGIEVGTVLYDQALTYLKSYLSWRSRSVAV